LIALKPLQSIWETHTLSVKIKLIILLILRAAASEWGDAQIADTTAMQSAPAFTTSLTLDSLIPPIATKG
jgi:hypothetical protein